MIRSQILFSCLFLMSAPVFGAASGSSVECGMLARSRSWRSQTPVADLGRFGVEDVRLEKFVSQAGRAKNVQKKNKPVARSMSPCAFGSMGRMH